MILYSVTATITDDHTAAEYIAWLEDGHLQGVLDGGAKTASIVQLDTEPDDPPGTTRIQSVYHFPDRNAFDRYVYEFAPALREDGLKRFGPDSGRNVRFERSIGEVVATL